MSADPGPVKDRAVVTRRGWDDDAFSEVQAHGAVVIVDRAGRVAHLAAGRGLLPDAASRTAVGEPAAALLGAEAAEAVQRWQDADAGPDGGWTPGSLPDGTAVRIRLFDAGPAHAGLDVTRAGAELDARRGADVERVAGWNDWLSRCTSSGELLGVVASVARQRLEYDGVWVQRSEPGGGALIVAADAPGGAEADWSPGRTIAREDLPRAHPRVRGRRQPVFVGDLSTPGARLEPLTTTVDLQGSALLRPSPQHLAGLAAHGIGAVAVLPLTVDSQLWGWVVGHAAQAHPVPSAVQSELRLLAASASARLAELIEQEDAREQVELARHSFRLLGTLSGASDLVATLAAEAGDLLGVCDADAAIVAIDDRLLGVGPVVGADPALLERLVAHARAALATRPDAPVCSSVTLGAGPGASPVAAGFLAAQLGRISGDVIVWLRRDDAEAVSWITDQVDGDAVASALLGGVDGAAEPARPQCRPWTNAQLAQVEELRAAIGDLQVTRYKKLRADNIELLRSNEEYDAFAHAAAHDLRAPLRGITQNAEFLLEDLEGRISEEEARQLHTITRLTDRMRDLLEGLMTYAQVGKAALEPQPVSLEGVVGEIVELLGLQVPAEVTLTVAPETFPADPGALRQVLLNLIGNAIKYAEGTPSVTVDVVPLADVRGRETTPATVGMLPGDTPVLRITDDGIGIDPSHHEHIFGLFRQLDPRAQGSGTGLAICRLISRRQGGDIWLGDPPRPRGTTFYLAAGGPAR